MFSSRRNAPVIARWERTPSPLFYFQFVSYCLTFLRSKPSDLHVIADMLHPLSKDLARPMPSWARRKRLFLLPFSPFTPRPGKRTIETGGLALRGSGWDCTMPSRLSRTSSFLLSPRQWQVAPVMTMAVTMLTEAYPGSRVIQKVQSLDPRCQLHKGWARWPVESVSFSDSLFAPWKLKTK